MMDKEMTTEQAKRLLKAIFDKPQDDDEDKMFDENYPETMLDKVGYAEYVLCADLGYIGKAINRLSRLHHLLKAAEKMENGLPPIITHNELRMALEHLLRVRNGIDEISDMLLEIYRDTKQKQNEHENGAANTGKEG